MLCSAYVRRSRTGKDFRKSWSSTRSYTFVYVPTGQPVCASTVYSNRRSINQRFQCVLIFIQVPLPMALAFQVATSRVFSRHQRCPNISHAKYSIFSMPKKMIGDSLSSCRGTPLWTRRKVTTSRRSLGGRKRVVVRWGHGGQMRKT